MIRIALTCLNTLENSKWKNAENCLQYLKVAVDLTWFLIGDQKTPKTRSQICEKRNKRIVNGTAE